MRIAGLVKSSIIDYPGKVAAVIFTQGCNFRCGFCHNPELIRINMPEPNDQEFGAVNTQKISESEIIDFLKTRIGKLEGVVITGGEPTLQPDLAEFIKNIKEMGYAIKLDTNGSAPQVLDSLITKQLVDYVAMDIKNVPGKYQETCSYHFSNQIRESITLIMGAGIDYEFRTTVLPRYHNLSDFEEIGKLIKGAKKYVIQGFRDEVVLDEKLKSTKKFAAKELEKIKSTLENYVKEVGIRENI